MDSLFSLFTTLPLPLWDTVVYILAGIGIIMLTYSVFLESERKQDAVFCISALCLLTYAIYINNIIFSVAMTFFALASFIELIEILMGRHIHSEELVEKYRHPEK